MSNDKKLNLIIIITTLIAILTLTNTYIISKKIDPVTADQSNNPTALYESEYYLNHRISPSLIDSRLTANCLIYIYQRNCAACTAADEYITAFIDLGYVEITNIYFIDVSDYEDETLEQLTAIVKTDITAVPMLLFFEDNSLTMTGAGVDEVYEVLDSIVGRYTS